MSRSQRHLIVPILISFLLLSAAFLPGCLQSAQTPTPAMVVNRIADDTIPVRTVFQAGQIPRLCTDAEQRANASLNTIASIPPGQRTVDNTLIAYDTTLSDYSDAVLPLVKIGSIYPDRRISDEALACQESSSNFNAAVLTRRDLYDAIREPAPRNPDESRLYTMTIRDFEKNGLRLDDEHLARLRALRSNLTSVELQYTANLNNDNTTLVFSRSELAGLSANDLSTLSQAANGSYLVSLKGPDVSTVLTKADRADVRKTVYAANLNRQAEKNTALLEEAILLRQQIAQELGYRTWADYQLDGRTAGNTSTVMAFLDSLKAPLKEKSRAELAGLLKIKQDLVPGATTVDPWDVGYLEEKQTRQLYAYSSDELKEYFPFDPVVQGVFSVYGSLYDIRFEALPDAPVWDENVKAYRVADLADNSTIGFLFIDPYPRVGKGQGYYETAIRSGHQKNGTYSVPVVLIGGNFPPPEKNKPSLLDMYDVETIFHETGHSMHELLTRVPYGTLSGTHVAWDFVETPSQAMEEWAWDPQVMESLSGKYYNRSEKIPAALRDKVIASRDANAGISYSSLLVGSLEDMRFHTAVGPVNVTRVYYDTYREVRGMEPLEGVHQPAQFDHLVDGYDAGYYGYLWSKVYALNVAGEFEKDGMTNSTTGAKFRQDVLAKGNMADGTVLLENFLGREPGPDALYARLGIAPGTPSRNTGNAG